MDNLIASFLNTALDVPDPLAAPMATARWWASVQSQIPVAPIRIHGKPRFSQELSDELRRLRSAVATLLEFGHVSYDGIASIPGAEPVSFPLMQALAFLYGSPGRDRLKRCTREACGRYFLDETKNGSKRWCSLRCMERARAPRRRTIAG